MPSELTADPAIPRTPRRDAVPGTQAVRRAITILKSFDEHHPTWEASALSADLGLTKATTVRLLHVLEAEGRLRRGERGVFQMGPDLIVMGRLASRSMGWRDSVRVELLALCEKTGESVTLEDRMRRRSSSMRSAGDTCSAFNSTTVDACRSTRPRHGHRVPHESATVHVSDLGLRRGFAVFEMFRVEAGVPLFLEDHITRLERSADAIGLPLPRSAPDITSDVHALVDANAPDVNAAQILLTGRTLE